ncbi:MAG: class I SAM-dependent methyltransferase [Candidatus Kapabacteria bacterium]|nr:class I SAM-dependent methyltransferase [Candidatus Kapabacteria bacterium]
MPKQKPVQTDWNTYYKSPSKIAIFARSLIAKRFVKLIKKHYILDSGSSIAELGGANSLYFDFINNNFAFGKFTVIDNNETGLEIFRNRLKGDNRIEFKNIDILNYFSEFQLDFVYSIGLIEHFSKEDTAKAIKTHFEMAKPGGIVIIAYPTPTFLYRITRWLEEITGTWEFHDERPLKYEEVNAIASKFGKIKARTIVWPIFLTQELLVFIKEL